MIELKKAKESDSEFVSIVERTVNNAVQSNNPGEVYVVQVDGWFDYKWQQFSGTVMHEIAVWRDKLTVPPFHPSRILSERYFRLSPDFGLYTEASAKPLHINQASALNLQRTIRDISSSGMFVWYSHISKDSDRASLMLYTVDAGDASGWYAGFTRKGEWRLAQVKGISRGAVTEFLSYGDQTANKLLHQPR
jgi:hypothetical protein